MNITPINPQNNLSTFNEIPEELLWIQNFNSANSTKTYKNAIQSFISFLGISKIEDLREITHAHVIAYKKYLQSEEFKPRTINNRLSAISSLFYHLIDQQIVKINPAIGVKRLKIDSNRVEAKALSPDEVRKLLDAPDMSTIQGLRDSAILHIFFFAGCRISEVCNLKIKDFYEEQGFFILDFWIKGGKRNRIAIHQEAQIAIMRYLKETDHISNKENYLVQPLRNNQNTKTLNRRITRKTIDRLWNKYSKKVEIKGSTPHSARATFITQALENNCPIEDVQKSVGHSQIKTTQMYDKRTVKYKQSASFAVRY